MESVRCPTPTVAGAGRSPKSPPEDTRHSPRNSPPVESEKSVTPSNERASSPEPNCAICLGKSQNKSFTDSCLHQFCFNCLLEWSKVKPECPLCKQSFKSIIHNVRSNEDYDQYHLRPAENPYPWVNMINIDVVQQRFRYRSTLTADRRLERALEHLEQDLHRRVEPGDIVPPQRTWRRRRGIAPDEFRMNVYNQNLWVTSLPSMGTGRDVTPQNFRARPEEVHRLIPWLNRELQAILRSPGLSARVLDLVINQLPRHHMQSPEFRFQLESYLRERYDHFIHEFYTFARSPYDMIGFDENANYSLEVVHEVPSDSSDSDVIIVPLEDGHTPSRSRSSSRRTTTVPPGPSSPVAGPSRAVLPVDQASDSDANNVSSSNSEVSLPSCMQDLATSSEIAEARPSRSNEGFDSDGCVIVGYVKPRHERTPEVITLLSSDAEVEEGEVTEVPQITCTGCYDRSYNYAFSTSTSSPDSSGSEYKPFPARRQQKKKAQHKGKSSSAAKSKARTSRKGDKTAATSTKRQSRSKLGYSSSNSSACSCSGKKSVRRRKARSPSTCSSSSRDRMSCSSISSSSSSNPTCVSRSSHGSRTWCRTRRSPHRDKKGSWRIQINMPNMKQEHDYSGVGYEPPYTSSEINSFLGGSSSNSRPKLHSIVITRAANGGGKYRESSGGSSHDKAKSSKDRPQKSKLRREDGASKKVKEEPASVPSTSKSGHVHHRGGSHSSQSSHRHEGSGKRLSKSNESSRRKHGKRDEKKKGKRRKDSESSVERKGHGSKSKKRKRILSLSSDSSDH